MNLLMKTLAVYPNATDLLPAHEQHQVEAQNSNNCSIFNATAPAASEIFGNDTSSNATAPPAVEVFNNAIPPSNGHQQIKPQCLDNLPTPIGPKSMEMAKTDSISNATAPPATEVFKNATSFNATAPPAEIFNNATSSNTTAVSPSNEQQQIKPQCLDNFPTLIGPKSMEMATNDSISNATAAPPAIEVFNNSTTFNATAGPLSNGQQQLQQHNSNNFPTPIGPKSMEMVCPKCKCHIQTKVRHQTTARTHLIGVLLSWYLCCCLPYFIDSCRNADHYCPGCKYYIGTYKS